MILAALYEAYAVRYGARPARTSEEFFRYGRYGQPDVPIALDYYVWLIRNDRRTVLVDSGYNVKRATAQGRYLNNDPNDDPLAVLARIGVTASDVHHVIVSHMHFDHAGNLDRFPNATFTIARDELAFCNTIHAQHSTIADAFDRHAIATLQSLVSQGRVEVVDDTKTLFPGLDVRVVGGHSPGQIATVVATNAGKVVIASDVAHFYDEFLKNRPYWFFDSLSSLLDGYDLLRRWDAEPKTLVVPGHDPAVMDQFPRLAGDVGVVLADRR